MSNHHANGRKILIANRTRVARMLAYAGTRNPRPDQLAAMVRDLAESHEELRLRVLRDLALAMKDVKVAEANPLLFKMMVQASIGRAEGSLFNLGEPLAAQAAE